LAIMVVAVGGVAALLLMPAGETEVDDGPPPAAVATPRSVLEQGDLSKPEVISLRSDEEGSDDESEREGTDGPSTVLWPLQVELELERSSILPEVPFGPPLGSGRTARFEGRIVAANGLPAEAEIEFVGGPNHGRILYTGEGGRFGAIDLYPGLEVVEIRGARILGSRREVRLRSGKTTELNIGYGQPGGVQGRVINEMGEGVEGALVNVDGHAARTDRTGHFYVHPVAAGNHILVVVEHPDYAPLRDDTAVARSTVAEARRLLYTLRPPAALRLSLESDIGGPGPAEVHLVPRHGGMNRDFPWYRVNPIALGREPVLVENLPAGEVEVRVTRPGAIGTPAARRVSLTAGGTETIAVRLEPAPVLTGRVVDDGEVVAGATVRMVAADPVASTLRAYGGEALGLEAEVTPMSAVVRRSTRTSGDGRFRLTAHEDLSEWRLLEALSPDGQRRAVVAVGPNQREVELSLSAVESGTGSLQLRLPRRFQAMPVEVEVNGRPGKRFEVPSRDELVVDGLAEGVWRLNVRWRGQRLVSDERLTLEDVVRRTVELPEEAILGQDRDTWLRAGREWPLDG
ncbi:MAG: hypothetical protein ACYSWX_11555, partial [Planctomycetota bacterium]